MVEERSSARTSTTGSTCSRDGAALRDRREDIPLLVRYFVQQYARRMNRKITTIPTESMTLSRATIGRQHSRAAEFHRAR